MKAQRRRFLKLAAGAAAFPAISRLASAESFPARPVTLVVFVPAGGSPDIVARFIGQALSQRLGQAIVIDNRPGGGGNLALQAVARAPADGYTLMLVAVPHAINATLHAKSNVHVATDIDPVAGIYSSAFVMLVNPAMPIGTVAEFIAYAKANPGKLNMTSSGAGNLSHLSGELFRMMTGVEMVHVPYKGTVPALAGLMAGDVHVMFDSLTSAMPHLQSGRLRGLAVTTTTRLAALPDIPTVAETVPGYVVNGWLGLGAPKGTPSEIIDRLNRETNAVLADPVIKARLAQVGGTALAGSPADFGRHVADATERWGRVIKFANIKSD